MFVLLLPFLLLIAFHILTSDGSEYHRTSHKSKKWAPWRGKPFWKRFHSGVTVAAHIPEKYKAEYPLPETAGPYIFGQFPHHVASVGHLFVMNNLLSQFEQLVHSGPRAHLVANVLFQIPLARFLFLNLGCIDADKSTCNRALKDGMSLYLLPGGLQEQTLSVNDKETVFLKKRKGFVKLAIEHQATLVPIFCFGEAKAYKMIKWWQPFSIFLANNFRIGMPLYYGEHGIPILDRAINKKYDYVFGKPILTKQYEGKVTQDIIDDVHQQFIQELKDLYEENKKQFGNENIPLQIL
jgi:1-acyl-sn-glycerol-3-phosphate acyltransferase